MHGSHIVRQNFQNQNHPPKFSNLLLLSKILSNFRQNFESETSLWPTKSDTSRWWSVVEVRVSVVRFRFLKVFRKFWIWDLGGQNFVKVFLSFGQSFDVKTLSLKVLTDWTTLPSRAI
jgi:hypothetical protein